MEETEVVEEIETEELPEGDETVEVPDFMIEEDEEEQTSDDPSKQVPVGKFVHLKKKLNGEISEKDKEIERLRSERDEARQSTSKAKVLTRPKEGDFADTAEFDLAVSKYDEVRLQDTYNKNRLREAQAQTQAQALEAIDTAVSEHVDRVEVLVEKHGISRDKVDLAHDNFSKAMSEAFPKLGINASKMIISMIGPGSETVVYSHGINKAKRDKLISLAKADTTGLKLAVYLGEQKQKLNNPTKPRSTAPDPAKKINGDEMTTGEASRQKKAYDKAGPGNSKSYNIKKAARKAGVDVSDW